MKRIVCAILMVCCLMNETVVRAENVEDTSAFNDSVEAVESMYLDGVEYSIELDLETGDLIVAGESEESKGELVIETNGNATVKIENDSSPDESYELDIDELSSESVDIKLYDENNSLIDSYDEYDEIVEDSYEGQVAISYGVVICVTALLYITTYYILVKSGVTYYLAESFTKAVAKAQEAARTKARSYYYKAVISNNNGKTMVYIDPHGINLNAAAKIVAADGSVYSYTSAMAKKVITKAGYIPVDSDGAQNTYEFHSKTSGYQFRHYHKGAITSNGSLKKNGSCHSLFGDPTYVK